ncbi:hypothetical protein NYE44_00115 [Paenibacillus sp. FSL L8-0493]|uniref:hypothetical protein n=1 Tax=Paenibacillus TaxID=44249 RepID=UPI00096CEE17|nr:hypothetical protein [Paenibacillus odorifer]OMD11618.1 hypothetical protein BJP47_26090 [Paenibacillus odorifer]OMD24209.1 hypothetical protein BJP48_26155 [Paenibacillus odorifer]
MKQTRIIKILIFSCIVALILAGCGTKAPSWDAFEGALNEKNFPVPQEAYSPDQTTTNVAMDYVRYSLPGLKEKNGIPEEYMDTIKAWGWVEQEEESTDSSGVFQKDGVTVHLTVHDDYFIVMIPKEKKALIKGLKTK